MSAKIQTERSTPIPVKTAPAGGNACTVTLGYTSNVITDWISGTYDASDPAKGLRKRGENIHHRIDPLHQPLISIPKLLKLPCLALKYG